MINRRIVDTEVVAFGDSLNLYDDALLIDMRAILDPKYIASGEALRDPLEHAGLFRRFADLQSPEAILAFARQFGILDEPDLLPGPKTEDNPDGEYPGETLERWHQEISAMRKAVEVWELLTAGDVQGLNRILSIRQEGTWYSVSRKDAPEEGSCPFSPPLVEVAAQHYLQHVINKRLENYTHTVLVYNRAQRKLDLIVTARFLLGALWLQFAQAVDGAKDFRQCRECGSWYELTPDKNRTSKHYCSNACKQKAYRKRKAEAKRLFEEGISIEEIAQRLESDVETVASWVK